MFLSDKKLITDLKERTFISKTNKVQTQMTKAGSNKQQSQHQADRLQTTKYQQDKKE